ncbi:MAG: hypothetical protein HYZ48_03760 [Chlamydiales bacterium]|nr:hypothetical protein [Chlamydiales bacterium]
MNNPMLFITDFFRKNSLFFKCLAVSCVLHLGVLIYFYTHPLSLSPDLKFLFNLSSASPDILDYEEENLDTADKNQMIEEAFREMVVTSTDYQQPLDLRELSSSVPLAPYPLFSPFRMGKQGCHPSDPD